MNKKAMAGWILLPLSAVLLIWAFWPFAPTVVRPTGKEQSSPTGHGPAKAKVRSSKALAALLKPENNVAASKEDRARREQQTTVLLRSINPKLSSAFQPMSGNLKAQTKEEVRALLRDRMASIGKTTEALNQSLEEMTNDPATAALVDKVDAQLSAFESASVEDREAQLPQLRADLEKVIDLIVAKAKVKLGR
jgi:hypothetical protein